MKFLIVGDVFSGIKDWLYYDDAAKGMPGVYNLYKYLGSSKEHSFYSIIINKDVSREIWFENGSSIKLIRLNINNHILFRLVSLYVAIKELLKALKKDEFDVLYGLANYSISTSFVGRAKGIFSVSRQFGSLIPELLIKKKYIKIYYRYFLDILACKYAKDLLISTNDGTEYHVLAERYKKNDIFHYFYNGIDKDFREQLKSLPILDYCDGDTLVISYIGRLSHWKRQDLALQALSVLIKDYHLRNIKMQFLGNGPDLLKLKQLAKTCGVLDYVEFLGIKDRGGLIQVLGSSHICLYLYDNGCLGNALWESLYSGTCVIARDSGDTKNVLSGHSKITSSCPKHIAKDIFDVISSGSINELAASGRLRVSKLIPDWETRFSKEFELISNVKKRNINN